MRLIPYLLLLLLFSPPVAAGPVGAFLSAAHDVAAQTTAETAWQADAVGEPSLRRQAQRRAAAVVAAFLAALPPRTPPRPRHAGESLYVPAPHLVRTPPLLC